MPSAPQTQTRTDFRVAGNRAAEHPGRTHGATVCPDCTDGLGKPRELEPGSFRARMHSNPGTRLAWRVAVFVAGLLLVMLGVALTVLPGPLTIPPILVGLWVWSTEFEWARRFFAAFKRKAVDTWRHAKQHPVSSAAVTIGGLAAAAFVFWAVGHWHLVDQGKRLVGLG